MHGALSARLSFFARLNPAIWDVIHQGRSQFVNELNGQPTPPKDPHAAHVAAANTARLLADTVISAAALGIDFRPMLDGTIRGWCGNEPRPFPPKGWPWPWPWPEPDPEPWYDVADIRGVGAVVLHGIAAQFGPGSEVGGALQDAALQLGAAAGL